MNNTWLVPSFYPQEHGQTYYTVTKVGKKYSCDCWGLEKVAGHRKNGKPFYRSIQCEHIKKILMALSSPQDSSKEEK